MDILFANANEVTAPWWMNLLPLLLMFLIFYFIVIRPQSRQRKEHENELASLAKGDRVLSQGGIIGKIVEFQGKDDQIIVLDTECNNSIKIQKTFILRKITSDKKNAS
tara:strand:- start:200 stop:523 length:324 start_codon:yes stop_codon:yes gene_type:complete